MSKYATLSRQAADDVAALVARIQATSPATLPLDYSFQSLDRIEDYVRAHREDENQVASYVGETLIRHAGGRWEPPKPDGDDGDAPLVTKLAIVPKARFYPAVVTFDALRLSRPVIRDSVEKHDIQHRRAALAEQLAKLPAELAALPDDIRHLTGDAPPVLDDSPAALTAVEDALVALITTPAPRETIRSVRTRVAFFLGELVRKRIGGAWGVSEDHRGDALGEFELDGWAPARTVLNIGPDNRGIFERVLPMIYKQGSAS